jgi:hypothetical protein
MEWQAFGFKDDPLQTSPITKNTLELFTGHREAIRVCTNVLKSSNNARIVIEGARGVGTTSFANYLRFNLEANKTYFTPRTEIKVEQGWRSETLLAAIISNFVRELELLPNNDVLLADEKFQAAKALSSRIAETYRSFGLDAFGFGASYGKQSGVVTQPVIVPSQTLSYHIEDLIKLVKQLGYSNGVLFQLNNMDIGEIHSQDEMKYLLNALRDYTQLDGSSWLLVGDVGLREFIAQSVDRLDDIISYEVKIDPLPIPELVEMINKRVRFYSESKKAELPIEHEVFYYLYKITSGRLRYVFGLLSRLLNRLYVGDLNDKITLAIAKPMLIKLGKDRMSHAGLTAVEEAVLVSLVALANTNAVATAPNIAKQLAKTPQYVGRVLARLIDNNLVSSHKVGRDRIYLPSIDAIIAYTRVE